MFNESSLAAEKWTATDFGSPPPVKKPEIKPTVETLSPQQIKDFLEAAKKEGYESGLKSGYADGMLKASAEIEQTKSTILNIAKNFNEVIGEQDELISEQVLKLSLDVSKAMIKSSLAVNKELIIPAIKEAIHQLHHAKNSARMILNHEDATVVKAILAQELAEVGWTIVEDSSLSHGDCIIETGLNQIDATNKTRWKRICDAIGQTEEEWPN